jgi:predicted DNA binding CopG/RHH family protein
MSDRELDYSDIPPSSDEELSIAKRAGRPKSGLTKQLIAIRLDPKLISRLKKLAKKQDMPYQSLIHQLLEDAVDDVA